VTRDRRHVNVFAGLLKSATDGGGFVLRNHGTREAPDLIMVNTESLAGRARTNTFPYDAFEEATLSLLAEVDRNDVLPRRPDAVARIDELRDRLKKIRAALTGLKEDLKRAGYDRHLADLLRQTSEEEERVAGELTEELARTARPAERLWGELPALVDLVRE